MNPQDLVERFRRISEDGFGTGDLAVLDELVAPDIVQHEPGPGQGDGLESIKAKVRMLHAAFPDLTATVADIFGVDDRVCARVTWSGTHTGEFAGLRPTGRTATWEGLDIARFAEGRVVEHWGQVDRLGMLQQLKA